MNIMKNREKKDKLITDGGVVESDNTISIIVTMICIVIILILVVLGALAIINS